MTDTVLFYAGELAIQAGGGIAIGSAINYIMPKHADMTSKSNAVKHGLEVVVQFAATAAGAVAFISFLQNRGFDARTNAIGSAAFWFWLLSSQPTLTSKVKGIVDLAASFLDEIDNDITSYLNPNPSTGGSNSGSGTTDVVTGTGCGCKN